MKFVKMHGAGNDYIFVDCFDISIDNMSEIAVKMSDRHFGIGGDGVIFLYPSFVADVSMRMFNSDGSEGAMCGNALRCIGRLFSDKNYENLTVETKAGVKYVRHNKDDTFTVDMGKPEFSYGISKPIFVCGKLFDYTYVSMGNPHCVIFAENIDTIEDGIGIALSTHSYFPDGINVEFCEGKGSKLRVRVFERGSGETLSCGTGACAAVAASVMTGRCEKEKDITVSLRGGDLCVNYSSNIYLTGNAVKVYEGEYYDQVHFCDGRSCQRTR